MHKFMTPFALATVLMSVSAQAHQDENRLGIEVRPEPIAGIHIKPWFQYRADVNDAEKELHTDLARAKTDYKRRKAWEEYRADLINADKDYVKKMRKRGYRAARVTVG